MSLYSRRQEKHIILFLFAIPFLAGMGVDLYVPSLPAITHYFQVSSQTIRLSVSYYMIGYGLGQILLGVISDSLGRRKILLGSGVFYTLISFCIAFAPSADFFNLGRFLQGVGIAGLGAVSRAVATDCFKGLEAKKVMTFVAMSFSLGPILAPFIGAYLQHFFNWQAGFYFFALYGVLVTLHVLLCLPETHHERRAFNLKSLFSILFEVLRSRFFITLCILCALIYGMMVMFSVVSPFLIQVGLKYSVITYGHIGLLLGFAYFIGNTSNRFLLNYIETKRLILIGLVCSSLAVLAFLFCTLLLPLTLAAVIAPVFLMFVFFGFMFSNFMSACLSAFAHIGGTASAIFGGLLGLGVALLGSVASSLQATYTALPLAISYTVIFLIVWLLFMSLARKKF